MIVSLQADLEGENFMYSPKEEVTEFPGLMQQVISHSPGTRPRSISC